ncbi:MAG: hypothetical protein ACTIAJ_18290 [Cellulosimicrobium funkei]
MQSAHREQAAGPQTAARLAAELHVLGRWLGVPEVDVAPVGDLAPALAAEVAAH